MSRITERCYPWVVAAAAIILTCWIGMHFDDKKMANQLGAAINISAILMGFTGTANAMLLSFNSKRFQNIRNNQGLWDLLIGYFRASLWGSLVLCFYSLILFSFDLDKLPDISVASIRLVDTVMPIWIGQLTFALLSFFRVLQAVFALLQRQ